ncbi:Uncharacterised protein [Pseudomonas luteola]|uniref:Uncharacterized protein n=1 Tax=Pseudomonas luteola TaxID=47886 RepID=A0A2X2CZI8_PSELU|nr:Uncharacterised protein [Pseudomonas luteola]
MTYNPQIHVFTKEQLDEHDLNIASKVHQATVASVVRQLNRKSPGQLLNSSRDNGKSLLWDDEKLKKVLAHIEDS